MGRERRGLSFLSMVAASFLPSVILAMFDVFGYEANVPSLMGVSVKWLQFFHVLVFIFMDALFLLALKVKVFSIYEVIASMMFGFICIFVSYFAVMAMSNSIIIFDGVVYLFLFINLVPLTQAIFYPSSIISYRLFKKYLNEASVGMSFFCLFIVVFYAIFYISSDFVGLSIVNNLDDYWYVPYIFGFLLIYNLFLLKKFAKLMTCFRLFCIS